MGTSLLVISVALLATSLAAVEDREDLLGNHPAPGTPLARLAPDDGSGRWILQSQTGSDRWSNFTLRADATAHLRLIAERTAAWQTLPAGEPTAVGDDDPWHAGDALEFCLEAGPGTIAVELAHRPTDAVVARGLLQDVPGCGDASGDGPTAA